MDPTLQQLEQRLSAALHKLSAHQTQLRLVDDSSHWSIQQIVEHLLMTYASTAAAFETRLAKGTPTRSRPSPSHRIRQFVVITLGRLPGSRKAPPEVTPSASATPCSAEALTNAIHESLASLDDILDRAEQSFGHAPCLSHFALGPLTATQWRRFHLSHGKHHIRQINAIRRAHGV